MAVEHNDVSERERRLDEVLGCYFEALAAGRAPDRQELLARHPDLAADLADFFADEEAVDRWTTSLRPVAQAALTDAVAAVLAPPPGGGLSPASDTPRPFGGGYELLEEIGRGGMGIVYKARQKVPSRVVALKVIRAGWLASPAEVQRFRAEAEAAASLDHPYIVPIYEVGEHQGSPFFSMKLVEGGSLAGQLDRYRNDPHAAARLVALVARAVHHAHQRGILHRDLKPSNILLDADGQSHVSDFGLAKRLDALAGCGGASLTETGAIIGTPTYMAPEQAAGKKGAVTTATDVYGLGSLLYALLVGRAPFAADTPLEALAQVTQREPEPPSRVNRGVDRDLETVCLKCLEKDPQRRYASAEALADDLERWLKGEPILARPLTWTTRLGRWCRRNPVVSALAATTGLLLVLGVVGLATGTWLLWREREETRAALTQARANYSQAEAERQRAEANFREAYRAVEHLLCAYEPERSARPLALTELRQWQTETALRFLAPFCEDPSAEPDRRLQKGAAYVHTGRVYQVLGDHEKAQEAFLQAIAVYDCLVLDFPEDPTYRRDQASALHILAVDLYQAGRIADANRYYRQAVNVWRQAVRDHPADLEARLQLANTLCFWFDRDLRDPVAALELARRAVELAPDVPSSWLALGIAYHRTGQWEAAREALQKAMRWPEVQGKWGWIRALFVLAMAQWQCGRHEEAIQSYREAERRMGQSFVARDTFNRTLRAEAGDVLGIEEPPPKPKEDAPRKE